MKRVVIVNEGEFGHLSSKKGSYNNWIGLLKRQIEETKKEVTVGTTREDWKVAEVEVVNSVDELLDELIRKGPRPVDIVMFISRSLLRFARELKTKYPRLKVIVFTGLIPHEEVVIVSKAWFGRKVIADLLVLD